jgi:hypothetical protein
MLDISEDVIPQCVPVVMHRISQTGPALRILLEPHCETHQRFMTAKARAAGTAATLPHDLQIADQSLNFGPVLRIQILIHPVTCHCSTLSVRFPQISRRPDDISDFVRGALFIVDTPVCKAPETTVRIQEYLLGTVVLKGFFCLSDNFFDGFSLGGPWIYNAEPYFAVRENLSHHVNIPCPRCCILKNKLTDSEPVEARDERRIVTCQQYLLRPAPVAAAYVKARPCSLHSLNHPVQKLGSVFQFRTRIPAGREGRSHEGPPFVLLGEDNFGQHRFIELHKLTSFTDEVKQLLPEDLHDIISHFLLIAIDRGGK